MRTPRADRVARGCRLRRRAFGPRNHALREGGIHKTLLCARSVAGGLPERCRRAPGSGRPRRRGCRSCTFFAVRCTIARLFGCPGGESARFGGCPKDDRRHHHCSDLRFYEIGSVVSMGGAARSCNEPQKTCTNGGFADEAATNLKKRARGRAFDASRRAPSGRANVRPAASRTKPAPIAAGRGAPTARGRPRARRGSGPAARRFVEVS